jgi:hypothetical protein
MCLTAIRTSSRRVSFFGTYRNQKTLTAFDQPRLRSEKACSVAKDLEAVALANAIVFGTSILI